MSKSLKELSLLEKEEIWRDYLSKGRPIKVYAQEYGVSYQKVMAAIDEKLLEYKKLRKK